MCGITGWTCRRADAPGRDALERMSAALVHRGPDGEGTFFADELGVAFGHRRLAIIDLTDASRQPMVDERSGVTMVYNGELYNFRELRRELRSRGVVFRSTGDAEVVLQAFVAWGEACFERFAGMFAVAFFDPRAGRVWLARDALGMKPLYLHPMPGGRGIAFASEVKAFRGLPHFDLRLRREGLAQYLELGYVFDERETILEGVEKVAPGEVVVLRDGEVLRRFRHFTLPLPSDDGALAEERRIDELAAAMETVVAQHLVADVPVGVLLSGGLDSSLVAALAARRGGLTTVSMGFADSDHDERPWGERVARHVGSRHFSVAITPGEVASEVQHAAWVFDDLFADWGTITTRILYRKCGGLGLKVVLVGEGADELFGGYPVFEAAQGRAGNLAVFRLYRRYASRRWGKLGPRFRSLMADLAADAGGDLFEAVRRFEVTRQLPNNYVMKVDKASMSVSIEARAPYLDRRIADIALRTPRAMLLKEGRNKHILRAVAERSGLLPDAVSQRPKVGGSIAHSWIEGVPEFREFARETVLRRGGWAESLGLRAAMERYFSGRRGYPFPHPLSLLGHLGWRLLLLELWSDHYLHPEAA